MAVRKINTKNRIQIVGSIDEDMYREFSEKLHEFEAKKVRDVFVELSSVGGHAYDALAFYSRMRLSPCNITVLAYGLVASAAVLVLAAGDRRLMTKEAWVMVHEDSVHKFSGDVEEVEKAAKQLRVSEDQWNVLLEDRTGTVWSHWEKLHKAEVFLTAMTCLNLNLVQEIV